VLFETTTRLKTQLESNRQTTASLLDRANQIRSQILSQQTLPTETSSGTDAPVPADPKVQKSLSDLQLRNQDLEDTVRECKEALEAIIEKHLQQTAELQQDYLQKSKELTQELVLERERLRSFRAENVQLKERIDEMLLVMKQSIAKDQEEDLEEETYIVALEKENAVLRAALGLVAAPK